MNEILLTRRRMLDALGRLGDELARDRVVADLHIVGGAVMVTEYDARESTADIDAVSFNPHGAVRKAALRVARQMDLPNHWLNELASAFAPPNPDWRRSSVFDHPNLRLYRISPEQLLAMKVQAARPTDAADIATLCGVLGLTLPADIEEIVERVFPGEVVSPRGLALVRDVLRQ